MIWDAKIDLSNVKVQDIVNALADFLKKIFNFLIEKEGWNA